MSTWGTSELRAAIAATYETVDPERDVLAFAGAEEAMYWALQELVGPGDHAVVTVPNYQSLETVTLGTGAAVSGWELRPENGWAPDLGELEALLRPETKLVAVNFPNNPTGAVPPRATVRGAGGAVRRARHRALQRRGLPRARARPGAHAPAGVRPVRARGVA